MEIVDFATLQSRVEGLPFCVVLRPFFRSSSRDPFFGVVGGFWGRRGSRLEVSGGRFSAPEKEVWKKSSKSSREQQRAAEMGRGGLTKLQGLHRSTGGFYTRHSLVPARHGGGDFNLKSASPSPPAPLLTVQSRTTNKYNRY